MSVIPRVFGIGGKLYLCIGSSIGFSLKNNATLYAEPDLWAAISPWMKDVGALDAALPKKVGEWLLVGNAHAPNQNPSAEWITSVRIGNSFKQLRIYGDRIFDANGLHPPERTMKVPLDLAKTWGGETVIENRLGCGLLNNDGQVIPPNIECYDFPWSGPDDQCYPGSMLPIDPLHPLRQQYAGTYDSGYLEQSFPGYPKDCSFRYFNTALPDQQINDYWRGDEMFELNNCHPSISQITGALPKIKARVLVGFYSQPLEEVDMKLSTIWFFPEEMKGVLVFHGLLQSESLEAIEVKRILGAIECTEEKPLAREYYEDAWAQRTGLDTKSALASLDDKILCSTKYDIHFSVIENAFNRNEERVISQEKHYKKFRDWIDLSLAKALEKAHKIEPSNKIIEDTTAKIYESSNLLLDQSPAELPGNIAELSKYIEGVRANNMSYQMLLKEKIDSSAQKLAMKLTELEKQYSEILKNLSSHAGAGLLPLTVKKLQEMVVDLEGVVVKNVFVMADNEKIVKDQLNQLKRFIASLELGLISNQKNIDKNLLNISGQNLFSQLKEAVTTKKTASHSPGERFSQLDEAVLGAPLVDWPDGRKNFEYLSMRGCNFSDREFNGLHIEHCDLQDSKFHNSTWEDCFFVGCNLYNCDLTKVKLRNVKFLQCQLSQVSAIKCECDNIKMIGCEAVNSIWDESLFLGAAVQESDFIKSSWRKAKLYRSSIITSNFSGAVQSFLKLNRVTWSQCDLGESDWSNSSIELCAFHRTEMPKIWRSSCLHQVSMSKLDLNSSDWSGSTLNCVDLSEANLQNSELTEVNAFNVRLTRSNLDGANLSKSQLHNCVLIEADLRNTSFLEARLLGSWFGNAMTNITTSWEDAEKASSCFYPRKVGT